MMRPLESGRFTQRQLLTGACTAVLALLALLFGLGVLEVSHLHSGRPSHASRRIRPLLEPFPVSEPLQESFERAPFQGEDVLGDLEAQARLRHVQRVLMQVLLLNEIESMAELGCGPLTWMEQVLRAYQKEDPKFRYLGLDIARPLIQSNQAKFGGDHKWAFHVFDATVSVVPDHYELIFCRDMMQHLPLVAVVDVLERISQSGARMVLLQTYKTLTPHEHNKNVGVGERFDVNLMSDPFDLVSPLAVYDENTYQLTKGTQPDKHLVLYSVEELRKIDYSAMRQRAFALAKER